MAKRNTRKSNSGAIALVIAIVVVLCLLISGISAKMYSLDNVYVEGNDHVSAEDIIRKAKITMGVDTRKIDKEVIFANFANEGSVELLDVVNTGMNAITLKVRECVPHVVTNYAGVNIVMDEYARVIDSGEAAQNYAVPTVMGLDIKSYQVGHILECNEVGMTESLQNVLQALCNVKTEIRNQITEINVDNLESMYFATKQGIMIKIGDRDDMESKMRWMKVALEDQIKKGAKSGAIDVSTGEAAYYSE